MTHRQSYACVVFAEVSSHGGFLSCASIVGTICTMVSLNKSKTKERASSETVALDWSFSDQQSGLSGNRKIYPITKHTPSSKQQYRHSLYFTIKEPVPEKD